MLFKVECDEVEDEKGSETSMSEMVSIGERGEETVGVSLIGRKRQIFLSCYWRTG